MGAKPIELNTEMELLPRGRENFDEVVFNRFSKTQKDINETLLS